MFINPKDLGVLGVPSEAPGGVERSLARRIVVLDLPGVPRVRKPTGRVSVTLAGCLIERCGCLSWGAALIVAAAPCKQGQSSHGCGESRAHGASISLHVRVASVRGPLARPMRRGGTSRIRSARSGFARLENLAVPSQMLKPWHFETC
jgi:hypothetical protein